jgi:hypothetical protein
MAAGIPLVPSQPADPYAWAVQQANQQYPRLAQFPPMRLTYNPKREGYSETFPPEGEKENPFPGNWTVEMGNSPYYTNRSSWPGLVALESLHMMQKVDPRYQAMTAQLQKSLTQQQLAEIDKRRAARPDLFTGDKRTRDQLLSQVFVPEIVRGRMFAPLFHQVEGAPVGGWNEYNLTPEQGKLIDQIDQYMRTTGR